jgi:lysophospholipase L1-like esterase
MLLLLAAGISACGWVDEGVDGNQAPDPAADNYAVLEGGSLDVPASQGVLANDRDGGSSRLTAELVEAPIHASSFELNPDGSFIYIHDGGESDSDRFSYTADDGIDKSEPKAVVITVAPINDPPSVTGQDPMPVSTPEESPLDVAAYLQVDDPDNSYPDGFTVVPGTGANYSVNGGSVIPATDYNGPLTVPVVVNDGELDSDAFSLSVVVTAVNDAPSITAQNRAQTPEDVPRAITLADLTVADPDNSYPDDFTLSVQAGSNYTVSGTTIIPPANFFGTLTVPVTVNDGAVDSAPFDLLVEVLSVPDRPLITGQQELSTPEETPLPITLNDLSVFDPDSVYPNDFTLSVRNGDNYAVAGNTITPARRFNGNLTVPVTVNDGALNSDPFNLTVTVTATNEAPRDIELSSSSVGENQPAGTRVGTFSTTDPDSGDTHSYALVAGSGDRDNSSFTVVGNELLTAASLSQGNYRIRVRSTDDGDLFVEKQFTITVTSANQPPVFVSEPVTTAALGRLYVYNVVVTDPNPGDAVTISARGNLPRWLTLTPTGNGTATLSGTPTLRELGRSYNVRLRATDDGDPEGRADQNFRISISPLFNDQGADAAGGCWGIRQEEALVASLPDEPALSAPLNYTLVTAPTKGTVRIEPTGQFSYLPAATGPRGRDSFSYQVEGRQGLHFTRSATVILDTKLMALGDSVTTGIIDATTNPAAPLPAPSQRGGYRVPLAEALHAAGYGVDFVGSQRYGDELPAFDPDNEGHEGWSDMELAYGSVTQDPDYPNSGIYHWLSEQPADVVLLHLGTDVPVSHTDGVEALLDAIDRWESDNGTSVTVLLGSTIDQNPADPEGTVTAFNTALETLVAARSDHGDLLLLVDQQQALWDAATGQPDPTLYQDPQHPNAQGYARMAETWFDALTEVLDRCASTNTALIGLQE